MQSHLAAEYVGWAELLLVLAIGAGVIVLAAAVAARRFRSAVWQRTVWQAATAAVLGLMAMESVGAGRGFAAWLRTVWPSTAAAPSDCVVTDELGDASAVVDPAARFVLSRPSDADVSTNGDFELGSADTMLSRERLPEASQSSASSFTASPPHPFTPSTILLVWGLGAAMILARMAWLRLRLIRVCRHQKEAAPAEARCCVDRIAGRVGLRRVRLLQRAGLSAPVAFGIVRPTVVLPEGFWDRFTSQEREAMLAHELTHLAAGDLLWQLLAQLCCAALWWHPAVWWLRGRLRAASETAADEASLLVPGGPDALAGCLLALGRRLVDPQPALSHGERGRAMGCGGLSFEGSGFRSSLGRRVERLLSLTAHASGVGRVSNPSYLARAGLKLVRVMVPVVLVIVSVLSTAWARTQASFEEGETQMSVWQSSWRHSLAATVLAAAWASAQPASAEDPAPKPPEAKPPAVRTETKDVRIEYRVVQANPGEQPKVVVAQAGKAGGDNVLRPFGPEIREMVMKRVELERRVPEIEARLREQPDGPEARKLKADLEKVRAEIADITQRLPEPMRHMKITIGEGGQTMSFSYPGGGGGFRGGFGGVAAPPPSSPEERKRLDKEIADLEAAARELKQAGKSDAAEAVSQTAERLKRRLAGPPAGMAGGGFGGGFGGGGSGGMGGGMGGGMMGGGGGMGGGVSGLMPPLTPEERERRMKHLKIAIDNLREAGLVAQAEAMARMGEAALQGQPMPKMPGGPGMPGMPGGPGMPGMGGGGGGGMMPGGPGMPGTGGGGGGMMFGGLQSPPGQAPGPPEDAVKQLQQEIQALQAQMNELRAQLKQRERGGRPRDEAPVPKR